MFIKKTDQYFSLPLQKEKAEDESSNLSWRIFKMKKDNILCIVAHSDDQVISMGSTIIQYASEGKNIISLILLYGERSGPWLKESYLIKTRVKESKKSGSGMPYLTKH